MSAAVRLTVLMVSVGILFVPPITVPVAAQPPRVEGYRCKPLAAQRPADRIWWTHFQGSRENIWDRRETYRAVVCFTRLADCKAWLYWAQSDWPQNQWLPCKRGLP